MFSDEEIKESSFLRPGDELISIREVCLSDKFDKKDFSLGNEPLLPSSGRNDLDVPRLFRDFEGLDQQQARFAWTEEDGYIASLVAEPGFGTGHTFGKDLDVDLKTEMKEADTSSSRSPPQFTTNRHGMTFSQKPYVETNGVSSTSAAGAGSDRKSGSVCKVDKTDPRSRFHYVKYVKRNGRTVKLWECGICTREFQHQYTLMRHLPTHTDERNFHCNECGKSFRQLSTLSQHRAIHSADRPYSCEVCNKTFNRVSTLISHRKTHSNEKPYRCHMCPKGFHQKGNLRNHLFTHTNERPYRCNICLKGFNQQSNLVCHKNKAHPDNLSPNTTASNTPHMSRQNSDITLDSTRSSIDCEVTSSIGPFLPSSEPSTSWHTPYSRNKRSSKIWNESSWSSGVIVDPIKTYHMGVALATRQTPFALLKPENAAPVLVKVVDTKMPNGKQMLVPATAEDLRVGGKIVMNNDNNSTNQLTFESSSSTESTNMVQIRVPVVATVVPRMNAGRLQLTVEEPHHAYHTATSNQGQFNMPSCSKGKHPTIHATTSSSMLRPETRRIDLGAFEQSPTRGVRMCSASLPPPTPSPPLDLIPMDLFEPMECIPLGPQITAVDSIDDGPPSDDSDIFIGKFEESIQLSDSD